MGYCESLKAAGAKVLEFEQEGSYQGNWIAVVEVNGAVLAILDSYGSCSGCDAFEAEFGFDLHSYDKHGDGTYFSSSDEGSWKDDCAECQVARVRLMKFGKDYLDQAVPVAALAAKMDADKWYADDKDYKTLRAVLTPYLEAP